MYTHSFCLRCLLLLLLVLLPLSMQPAAIAAPNARRLVEVGYLAPGFTQIAVEDEYAYLAGGPALTIVSITDPDQPRVMNTTHLPAAVIDLTVTQSWVYLLLPGGWIIVIDAQRPTAPEIRYIFQVEQAEVVASGPGVLAAAGDRQLHIFDLTTPAVPNFITTIRYQGGDYRTFETCLTMHGDMLYLATGDYEVYDRITWLYGFDLSDPAHPRQVFVAEGTGMPTDIAVADGIAALSVIGNIGAYDRMELHLFDVRDPSRVTLISQLTDLGVYVDTAQVALTPNAAFLSATGRIPYIFPLPLATQSAYLWKRIDMPSWDMIARETLLYIAAGPRGFQIVDISDLEAPQLRGNINAMGNPVDLVLFEGRLYLADGGTPSAGGLSGLEYNIYGGLVVVQPGTSNTVKIVGKVWYSSAGAGRILIDGKHAYLSTSVRSDGLGLVGSNTYISQFDLANPDQPDLLGTTQLDEPLQIFGPDGIASPRGMDFHANKLLLTDGVDGLFVIGTEGDAAPPRLAALLIETPPLGVASDGEHIYTISFKYGLTVYSLSEDYTLTEVAAYPTLGGVNLTIAGDYAYVAGGEKGLIILDISEPTAIQIITNWDTPGYANLVRIVGNRAYIADGPAGLQILDISQPAAPTLLYRYNTPGNTQSVTDDGRFIYVADGPGGLIVLAEVEPQAYLPLVGQ